MVKREWKTPFGKVITKSKVSKTIRQNPDISRTLNQHQIRNQIDSCGNGRQNIDQDTYVLSLHSDLKHSEVCVLILYWEKVDSGETLKRYESSAVPRKKDHKIDLTTSNNYCGHDINVKTLWRQRVREVLSISILSLFTLRLRGETGGKD